MRGVVAVVLLAALLLSGCFRPTAAGREPDRPSIPAPDQEIRGQLLGFNGTMLVSSVPAALAPVYSPDEPMNCFTLNSVDDKQSYLGGAVLDLVWSSTSDLTRKLEVTLTEDLGVQWSGSGPSPLHLVFPAGEDEGEPLMLTPLTIRVAPAGNGVAPDLQVDVGVTVGLLESLIAGFTADQCPA